MLVNRVYQIIVKRDDRLDRIMFDSARIYNQALYFLRQNYFGAIKNGTAFKTISYTQLYHLVKVCDCYKVATEVHIKQAAIRQAFDMWKAFIAASKSFKTDPSRFTGRPKPPKYIKTAYFKAEVDKQFLNKRNLSAYQFRLPKTDYTVSLPPNIKRDDVRCVRIVPFFDKIKIEICYLKDTTALKLDFNSAISADIGVNNLMSITSNNQCFSSMIVNGRPIKSINRFFNKIRAKIVSCLEICNSCKTSKRLQRLSRKRDLKIKDYMHKASRFIVNQCVANNIGTIVIGHNDGWKQDVNIGAKNNQNFVSIPFNTLINMIKYKAEDVGIKVIITEESYTSKTDHLICEAMKHVDNRPNKRIRRGLFKSDYNRRLINADINGAIGILRKAKVVTDRDIVSLRDRGDLSSPRVFTFK